MLWFVVDWPLGQDVLFTPVHDVGESLNEPVHVMWGKGLAVRDGSGSWNVRKGKDLAGRRQPVGH